MISLFGSSLLSKVSLRAIARIGTEQGASQSEKSKKVRGRRKRCRIDGKEGKIISEKDTDSRLETTPPSRRTSSIHQRPRPLLFRLLLWISNARYPRILGTFSYNGHVAFRPIGYCSDFRWFSHFTGGCCFTLRSAVMLYPGELEGICLS